MMLIFKTAGIADHSY